MSDDSSIQNWLTDLTGQDADQQVAALRQIASEESTIGLCEAVVKLAGSQHDEVRMWAAEALETSIQPQAADIGCLIQLLQPSGDGEINYWAATMLGRLGSTAAEGSSVLADFVATSDFLAARERAVWALSQIGPAAATALPILQSIVDDAPPRLQRMAQQAMELIQADGEVAA